MAWWTMTNSIVKDGGGYGVFVNNDLHPYITNTLFQGNPETAIGMIGARSDLRFHNLTAIGNNLDVIRIGGNSTMQGDRIWQDAGILICSWVLPETRLAYPDDRAGHPYPVRGVIQDFTLAGRSRRLVYPAVDHFHRANCHIWLLEWYLSGGHRLLRRHKRTLNLPRSNMAAVVTMAPTCMCYQARCRCATALSVMAGMTGPEFILWPTAVPW